MQRQPFLREEQFTRFLRTRLAHGRDSDSNAQHRQRDSNEGDFPTFSSAGPARQAAGSLAAFPYPTQMDMVDGETVHEHTCIDPTSPWTPYDASNWDVKVVCKCFQWYLHKVVLRKCRYFSAMLPLNCEDEQRWSGIELHEHDPGQLAQVLRFMYYFDYPGAIYDHANPLHGDSVLTNTAMYLAGASVGHHGMMQFAIRRIEEWTDAVFPPPPARRPYRRQQGIVPGMVPGMAPGTVHISACFRSPLYEAVCDSDGTMDHAILRLIGPLYNALRIVYEQPLDVRANALLELRVALIRFMATALPLLAVNAAFQAHFRNEWERPLRPSSLDHNPSASGSCREAKPAPRTDGLSIVDHIVIDYATFFDLHLVGWPKGHVAAETLHTLKPPQPSLGKTVALLRRLARNERSWVDDAPSGDGQTDRHDVAMADHDNNVPDNETRNVMDDADTGHKNIETRTEAQIDRDYRKICLDTSLWDHEMTLGEIMLGLERIISR